MLPILYSYRRCPYAMRARMALKLAEISVEIREISLREKPQEMLKISPKGTVPVLMLPDRVIDESLDIIDWVVKQGALGGAWILSPRAYALLSENDGDFKRALDAYKYPEKNTQKTQIEHRAEGEVFLQKLEILLQKNTFLFGAQANLADIAIFPFVRQFAAVDASWWQSAPYPKLSVWLKNWLESDLFVSIMQKQPTYMT